MKTAQIFYCLIIWGIASVGTTSFPLSWQRYGNPWHYLLHQLVMLAIGIVLAVAFFKLPLKKLKKWAPLFFLLSLLMVICVFLPKIGVEIRGARRWLNFGKFLLQPSEFLKIGFIIYLAAWLAEKGKTDKKKKLKYLLIPFFIICVVLLVILIVQPDMSTLAIIFVAGVLMYFAANTPLWHTFAILGLGTAGGLLLIKMKPYRWARFLVFLKPETDPLGMGYQLRQALIGMGSGRIFGVDKGFSLGLSRQKFGFLPDSMTDSIFAIIGEELGFIGATLLILLFLALIWRGVRLSALTGGGFEKFLALGITVWIVCQAFFNIGGILGLLPLAGIPLPFFSYGGSHLIAEMVGVGILLNISKNTN